MEYVLDRIGTASFRLLSSELVKELTQHSIEAVDSAPLRCTRSPEPVNLRWPSFLGGEVWGGLILIDCLYVSESDQSLWTSARLTSHLQDRLEHEVRIRENEGARRRLREDGRSDAHAEGEMTTLENVPEYIVFATNLAPRIVDAATDAAIQKTSSALGLRGWKVWDRATVGKMLDVADSVRRKYLPELAPKNIMNLLHEYDVGISSRLLQLFKVQMINELKANQWVRLSQAGDADSARLPLGKVGIDLPVKDQAREAARLIIEEADAASTFRGSGKTANVLLVGGPGQGKSTITQLIGQCYRVALLDGSLDPDHPTQPLAAALAQGFHEAGVPLPQFRRWPVRIDLASYVDAAVDYRQTSLIAYIAEQAERRAGGMSGPKVKTWLRAWPWLMILDGFDEVASSHGRETLMDQLDNFMGEVEGLGADVFIVATTRPQGYAGEFAQHGYREFELVPLNVARAIKYGEKLAEARHGDQDSDMRDRVKERLNRAANDRLTARLMRSPLQVSIMSTLLEARERVPRARFELFDAYYQAIYSRESEKPGLGELLEKRRSHINALHNWLGLVLQANSEKAGDLDASVPHEELRRNAIERLEKEGHDAKKASALADEIVNAVTSRLVLIVPKKLEDVGFEVRSIQEFFAARAIVFGPDNCVLDRLNSIIAPAHWRNTWLFAAGKAFLEREHIRLDIVSLLIQIDNTDLTRMVVAPGADLALDLLEDDIASDFPLLQHMLFRHAFELTKYPPDQDLRRRALVLFQLAENDVYLAGVMERSIDEAIAGTPGQLDAAHAVLESADRRATQLAFRFRDRLRGIEKMISARTAVVEDHSQVLEQTLTATLRDADLSESDHRLAEQFISGFTTDSIRSDAVTGDPREQALSRELLDKCLTRDPVADVLAKATIAAAQVDSRSGSELRGLMRSWLQRRAAGRKLVEMTYG